jgi:hypothetical protein
VIRDDSFDANNCTNRHLISSLFFDISTLFVGSLSVWWTTEGVMVVTSTIVHDTQHSGKIHVLLAADAPC